MKAIVRTKRTPGGRAPSWALLALFLPGCVITQDGVERTEVSLPDIFPPSKTVASYRQLEKPQRLSGQAFAQHLGSAKKTAILKKWGSFSTLYCDYGLPKHKPKVRVSVTEMGQKLTCYGAYTNLRPGLLPEKQYVKIGTHGTLDGARLIFVQDRYLIVVRDLSHAPEARRRALLINFGRAIARRIPRPITNITPVTFLPYRNRVTASERLDKDDPLGLGIFKTGAVTALYRKDNREAKIFLSKVADTWLKQRAIKRFKKLMEANGKVEELNIGELGYQGKLFGKDCLVAQREDVVFGVFGNMTGQEMQQIMAATDRKIKPFLPTKWRDVQKQEKKQEKAKAARSEGSGGY